MIIRLKIQKKMMIGVILTKKYLKNKMKIIKTVKVVIKIRNKQNKILKL